MQNQQYNLRQILYHITNLLKQPVRLKPAFFFYTAGFSSGLRVCRSWFEKDGKTYHTVVGKLLTKHASMLIDRRNIRITSSSRKESFFFVRVSPDRTDLRCKQTVVSLFSHGFIIRGSCGLVQTCSCHVITQCGVDLIQIASYYVTPFGRL